MDDRRLKGGEDRKEEENELPEESSGKKTFQKFQKERLR